MSYPSPKGAGASSLPPVPRLFPFSTFVFVFNVRRARTTAKGRLGSGGQGVDDVIVSIALQCFTLIESANGFRDFLKAPPGEHGEPSTG